MVIERTYVKGHYEVTMKHRPDGNALRHDQTYVYEAYVNPKSEECK